MEINSYQNEYIKVWKTVWQVKKLEVYLEHWFLTCGKFPTCGEW